MTARPLLVSPPDPATPDPKPQKPHHTAYTNAFVVGEETIKQCCATGYRTTRQRHDAARLHHQEHTRAACLEARALISDGRFERYLSLPQSLDHQPTVRRSR